MDRSEKIPLSATSFPDVMASIVAAFRILDIYDFEALHAALTDRDGMLSFRDPTMFLRVQADPQWKMKCDLVASAARFSRHVSEIIRTLGDGT